MKAVQVRMPAMAGLVDIPDLTQLAENEILLRVDLVGMCGTDLTTFRGGNPMVAFPRILGHEVAATVEEARPALPVRRSPSLSTPIAAVAPVAVEGASTPVKTIRPWASSATAP